MKCQFLGDLLAGICTPHCRGVIGTGCISTFAGANSCLRIQWESPSCEARTPHLTGDLMDCDVLVIGSGFGGAITACRLAEKGRKVRVLERGRRWDKTTYPRQPTDEWIWSRAHPERYHGWSDLRRFDGMSV